MEVLMRHNYLKGLFRKNEFDWDNREYLKKTLSLLEMTKTFHLYEDDKDAKQQLVVDLINLMQTDTD